MAGIHVTVVGNLARDPELKCTPSGAFVATFTIACNERIRGDDGQWRDGPTSWVRCNAWSDLAEHLAESVSKGDRVIVSGQLRQREYTGKDNVRKSAWEVTVAEAGPSLRYATAKTVKAERYDAPPAAADNPWASDAPPF